MGIASVRAKLAIAEKLTARKAEFLTYIHPTAVVSPFATIGTGTIILPYAIVSTNVRIGDFVAVNCSTGIGHDVTIGDGCTINSNCDLTGHTQFGR